MTCTACGAVSGDGFRFCPMCGAPLQASASTREARKHVSMLFVDIVGSTALAERLDPEALRQVVDRYFAGCSESVAAHGGLVEKFIGDAVLAVFGADVSHEDDALRAVRAAADALSALNELNAELAASHRERLEARCGVCSGEVMVLTSAEGGFRVVGDAVNTASRLQNAAGPGEIFIDASTANIVKAHIGLEPVPPLTLKGKANAVPAWRVTLRELPDTAAAARQLGRFVGRSDELDEVRQAYRRALRRSQPCLVTILGPPGIGKSRLVREFSVGLDGTDATVLAGRCSAYGRGITYKPLVEALESYPGGWPALSQALAADPERGRPALARLSTVLGQDTGEGHASVGIEEITWAVRCLFEILGESGPVVVVWEDLHWAEETLLDLIDDIATWLSDVPVLLLCAARPELLDARPTWGGGKPCAVTLDVPPLSREQCAELVSELALHADVYAQQDDVYARVAVECDGNPLFAELMLDVLAEVAPSTSVPPTIHALLGARLDQLPGEERQLVERTAVIGREFSWDTLLAMAQEDGISEPEVRELTNRLVRRRLWQRAGPTGSYRFTQALLRDTAYTFTPKSRREQWHQFLARWLAEHRTAADGASQDSTMAFVYHVETACQLRRELSPGDASLPDLAPQAAELLMAEGNMALRRKDLRAAAALLERGRILLPAGDCRQILLALRISDAWLSLWDENRALAALAVAEAALPGDRRAGLTCEIQRLIIALRLGRAEPQEVQARAALLSADLQAEPADDLSWCRFFQLRGYLQFSAEQAGDAGESLRLGLERARALNDRYEEEKIICAICELAQWDPTHVAVSLALCDELADRFAANRPLLVPVLVTRARLSALAGDLDIARQTLATVFRHASELHLEIAEAAALEVSGFVESLAGAYGKAESCYGRAESILRAGGQEHEAQTLAAERARALFEQGRPEEARAALEGLVMSQQAMDLRTQVMVKALRGRLASAGGADAVALAREAAGLAGRTQDPCLQSDVLFDLARVLQEEGIADEAAAAAAAALAHSEEKGAETAAERIRHWCAAQASGTGGRPGDGIIPVAGEDQPGGPA
jgi:class 3 adenylate cyclase/tetratricopeptide (TPR) repeat protein